MRPVETPFKIYTGLTGQPLNNGYVYFGVANQNPITSPITVYWDAAGTQPAAQPLRTVNGYIVRAGTPANVFVGVSYSELVKDSAGRQVFYARNSDDFSIGTVIINFLATLAASGGSALIGFIAAGVGAVLRTVQAKLRDVVTVNDFVTGGTGTEADPWTGWDTRIVWTSHTQYNFIDGHYSYATSPNFGLDYLRLKGTSATVIHHTGAGYAMTVDAGAATTLRVGLDIKIRLESNAAATGGVLFRGCSHSKTDIVFRNVPGICFTESFGVLNTHVLEHTALVVGETLAPASLLAVNIRGVGEESSANKYYLIAENCTSHGVILNECLNSQFIGGTSETNGGNGYFIGANSNYNTFIGIDLEVNTGNYLYCVGSFNTFINALVTGTATLGGRNNRFLGGTYNDIADGGTNNQFDGVVYSNNGGAFTTPGVGTIKRNVYNATSGLYDLDLMPSTSTTNFTYTGTLTGSTGVLNIGSGQIYKTAAGEVLVGSTSSIAGKLQVTNSANTATDQNWRSIMGVNANTTTAYHLICTTGAGVDKLYIFGNGNVQNANNSYGAISDAKLKENVADTSSKLADLMRVRVVNYGLKAEPGSKYLGVIAQELEEIFPGMIEETMDMVQVKKTRIVAGATPDDPDVAEEYEEMVPNGEMTKGVKYSVFVPILIKTMQELNAKFDAYVDTHP